MRILWSIIGILLITMKYKMKRVPPYFSNIINFGRDNHTPPLLHTNCHARLMLSLPFVMDVRKCFYTIDFRPAQFGKCILMHFLCKFNQLCWISVTPCHFEKMSGISYGPYLLGFTLNFIIITIDFEFHSCALTAKTPGIC